MAHKHASQTIDRTLKDVMSGYNNSNEVFGGKIVVFGGDFRKIIPVVPRATRYHIVRYIINAYYICHLYKFNKECASTLWSD